MVRLLVVLVHLLLWVGDTATAQTKTTTFRDPMGRTTGKAVTDPTGRTNYYDPMGQTTGRSVTTGAGTTFYDRMGRQSGSGVIRRN